MSLTSHRRDGTGRSRSGTGAGAGGDAGARGAGAGAEETSATDAKVGGSVSGPGSQAAQALLTSENLGLAGRK